jgi:large subunit ribosomal protein L29
LRTDLLPARRTPSLTTTLLDKQGLLYPATGSTWPLHHVLHWNQGDPREGPASDVEKEQAMNAKELHDKTPDQLREELVSLKKESFNLRFQQATGQLENAARIRAARRNAARVKTVLNQKAAQAATE